MGLKKAGTSTGSSSASKGGRNSADVQRRQARTLAKQQQASERIAGATVSLSQGLADASTAREQLNSAVNEISTGAEEASSASAESNDAVVLIQTQIKDQLDNATSSAEKTLALQQLVDTVNGDVSNLITNVSAASNRQAESALMMNELEKQASNINDSVKQVMRIADQTNLLALNAAIEAGRAGKHGKGFAVVADTVRTLAETSESNAVDIAKLIEEIQSKSRSVGESVKTAAETAEAEVEKGKTITKQLAELKTDMAAIYSGGQEIATGASQMEVAINDAQKASETIAAASEEQSSAANEVLRTLDEQRQALTGAETASQELEIQSEELKNSTDISKSSEEVAAAAEELSTSIEEISRAAGEIMTAISQISRGAEQAASASEEASAGMVQIERTVEIAETRANVALEKGEAFTGALVTNKADTDSMINALITAAEQGKAVLKDIQEIEQLSRRIDKITDAIATVSIKTGMLAVNGAIEAARAGEFGKGFAVVSGDIQSLADDAAENIEQIKDLVKGIQDQSVAVMTDVASVSEENIAEVEKAKVTTSNLERIESDMTEVLEGNQGILKASQEIASAVGVTKRSMEQIAAASEEAASNAGEASTAADQQSRGSEDLAAAIEEIASIADELQSM